MATDAGLHVVIGNIFRQQFSYFKLSQQQQVISKASKAVHYSRSYLCTKLNHKHAAGEQADFLEAQRF